MNISYRLLERYGIEIEQDLETKLRNFRLMRNSITHGRNEPTREDVVTAVDTVEELEKKLNTIDKEEAKSRAKAITAEERKRREEYSRVERPRDRSENSTS